MRTLPLRLSPIEGESLIGYVARYAHAFQFQPGDVIRALELDRGAGSAAAAGRFGAWLSAEQLKGVAFATGIDGDRLEQMLLSRYAGRAFDRSALTADRLLARAAQAHEVLIWSSRFCPLCLREDGAWLLRWQLSWSVVCVRHGVLLARSCPTCGAVPRIGPRARWSEDRRGALTDPTRCWRRRERQLCRCRLSAADVSAPSDEVLAAQRRIDGLLDDDARSVLAGQELDPLAFLRDLRALCTLLHRRLLPARRSGPLTDLRGIRLFDDPPALSTVLAHALKLADLPDRQALTAELRRLADQRYRADGQTLGLDTVAGLSPLLADALRHAVSGTVWATASSRMGFHPRAHRRPGDLDQRLELHHVPQQFWAEDYRREIAEVFDFDDFTDWLGRRFCSVLLARMLAPLTWQEAVRSLDFPERFINDGYNTTFTKLRANDRFDELCRRIKRIANDHAQQGLVEYKQRRVRLADWDGIDLDCWHLLQPRARPPVPFLRRDAPVRRAHASVWLWCELTSGHERAAPVRLPTHNLAWHTYFIRDALPALRERLLILGELLLATPADERSTLYNRLAATLRQHGYLAENFRLGSIDPLITSRVLAHVSAHTGVDIPSLRTRSQEPRTPPAIKHARLLTGALLRRIALASWMAVAPTIGGDGNRLADDQRAYRAAREREPRLASEFEQLALAIENWQAPAPRVPTTPHRDRMREIALAIKARAAGLLAASHGPQVARHTSIAVCRQHTDLTCPALASLHNTPDAQPTPSRTIVARHRRDDSDFDLRYRQLLAYAGQLQRKAGFANANLRAGLSSRNPVACVKTPATEN